MNAVASEVIKRPALKESRFETAQAARNLWCVTTEPGTTKEQIMQPDFWAHVARQMQPFDKIEVRCDDSSYYGEFIVLDVGRNEARIREINFVSLEYKPELIEQTSMSGLEPAWRGPKLRWCVERKHDKARLVDGLADKADAYTWITNHEKKV